MSDKRFDINWNDSELRTLDVPSQGYNNRVYKSQSLPEAPDYTPANYDYKFLKSALSVKDLVLFQQGRQAANDAGHTAFNVMGYDELRRYVLPIQEHLVEIGYLDEGDADGIMGPKTEGAIKRYEFNKPGMIEEAFFKLKQSDLNIFD